MKTLRKKRGIFYFMSTNLDKQRILTTELPRLERRQSYCRYAGVPNNYDDYKELYGDDWKVAHQINHNGYRRVKKIKNKIQTAVQSSNAIFLTLTFTDDVLNSTSIQTRRKYASLFLKSVSSRYVANIDFGKLNEREHYHAIVECDKVDRTLWKYGAINFKRVPPCELDQTRIAKYVAKLTNHAIKKSAHNYRLIYSRKKFD